MSEKVGGCLACSSCIGFKSVSATGKFCSRCSHPLAKHFEGDRPQDTRDPAAALHRHPSAASLAPLRDGELKLYMDVDQSAIEAQKMASKVTPPARRMSSNQNPLASRSPMNKSRMSPMAGASSPMNPLAADKVRDEPPTTAKGGIAKKPDPIITGPSLKERLTAYQLVATKSSSDQGQGDDAAAESPKALTPGTLKQTAFFKVFESGGASVTPPLSSSVSAPQLAKESPQTHELTSPDRPRIIIKKQTPVRNDSVAAKVGSPPPPVVTIESPSKSSLQKQPSLKERISVTTTEAVAGADGVTTSHVRKMSYDETSVFENVSTMPSSNPSESNITNDSVDSEQTGTLERSSVDATLLAQEVLDATTAASDIQQDDSENSKYIVNLSEKASTADGSSNSHASEDRDKNWPLNEIVLNEICDKPSDMVAPNSPEQFTALSPITHASVYGHNHVTANISSDDAPA